MHKYIKAELTEPAAVMGVPASWSVVAWSWFEPLYSILQILALVAAIAASYATARYYIKRSKNGK